MAMVFPNRQAAARQQNYRGGRTCWWWRCRWRPPETAREIAPTVDAWVCLDMPAGFAAVGQFFRDFTQVEDAEVVTLLKKARKIES